MRVIAGNQLGSGVVIEGGIVLTNEHVVRGHGSVTIATPSGKQYTGTVVSQDAGQDLAAIRITSKLPHYSFDQFRDATENETAKLVGYEGGQWLREIRGIIHGPTQARMERQHQRGMSGSPCFAGGYFVGLHTGDSGNMAYIVPASRCLRFIRRLLGYPEGVLVPIQRPAPTSQPHGHADYATKAELEQLRNQIAELVQITKMLQGQLDILREAGGGQPGPPGNIGPQGIRGPAGPPGVVTVVLVEDGKETRRVPGVASGSNVVVTVNEKAKGGN